MQGEQPRPTPPTEGRMTTNPWRARLEQQGLNFSIPSRPLPEWMTGDLQIDELTHLVTENDNSRRHVAERLSGAIRNGESWFAFTTDADNLKQANDNIDRQFGDMVIAFGAARIGQAIERAALSPHVDAITMRWGSGADETMTWLFGLSEAEEESLRRELEIAQTPHVVKIPEIEKPPSFVFSTTIAIATSNDPRIQHQLNETQQWLSEHPDATAFNFMQNIVTATTQEVKLTKIEKDLARLPIEELLTMNGVETLHEYIVKTLGNSRISDKLLDLTLQLSSVQAARAMMNSIPNQEAYQEMLRRFGVTEEQLNQAKTAEQLQNLYTSMFGSIQEQAT